MHVCYNVNQNISQNEKENSRFNRLSILEVAIYHRIFIIHNKNNYLPGDLLNRWMYVLLSND